jgi:high-affinity nickel-transport protein
LTTAIARPHFDRTWSRAERRRLALILAAVLMLHVLGVALHLFFSGDPAGAGGLAGSAMLAYMLGVRHAFDADHIAAIDDTTRLMLVRGRRSVGVGFFFAMGHSTVVLVLALLIAFGASSLNSTELAGVQEAGGLVAAIVAIVFLLLVAGLNSLVLRNLVTLVRRLRAGEEVSGDLEHSLAERGLFNRLLGGRFRSLIRSSWHMYPVGLLMGLGLETASEIALLTLTASAATGGTMSLLAVLSLPLLFAAGMSAFDTADSLFMARAYSWSYHDPQRRLYFNTATTGVTVVIGFFVAGIYLCGLLAELPVFGWLAPVADVSQNFELFGYAVVGMFIVAYVASWVFTRSRNAGTEATERPSNFPSRK